MTRRRDAFRQRSTAPGTLAGTEADEQASGCQAWAEPGWTFAKRTAQRWLVQVSGPPRRSARQPALDKASRRRMRTCAGTGRERPDSPTRFVSAASTIDASTFSGRDPTSAPNLVNEIYFVPRLLHSLLSGTGCQAVSRSRTPCVRLLCDFAPSRLCVNDSDLARARSKSGSN